MMSATPGSPTRVPDAVCIALMASRNFAMSAPGGLDIISGVLEAMREAVEADKPVDASIVDRWRWQARWVLERINADLDEVRNRLRETGVLPERG
jgi:gamma-glutamyltranspeptidase